MIILTGKADSYAQFITVLLIFVAVLAVNGSQDTRKNREWKAILK